MKKIRVKLKELKKLDWDNFIKYLSEYANDKYGASISEVDSGIIVKDIVSIALYDKSEINNWRIRYNNDNSFSFKDEFDKLIYSQTVQMFINMFPEDSVLYS